MELQFLPHPVLCMTLFFSGYDIRVVLKVETKMPAVKLTDVGAYTSRSVMVFLIDHTIYRHKVLAQIPAKSVNLFEGNLMLYFTAGFTSLQPNEIFRKNKADAK